VHSAFDHRRPGKVLDDPDAGDELPRYRRHLSIRYEFCRHQLEDENASGGANGFIRQIGVRAFTSSRRESGGEQGKCREEGSHAAQRRVKRPRAERTSGNTMACPRGPLERIVRCHDAETLATANTTGPDRVCSTGDRVDDEFRTYVEVLAGLVSLHACGRRGTESHINAPELRTVEL
jgi:hypothetical protein